MTLGRRNPSKVGSASAVTQGPDANASGWRRYVQVARLKALRPNFAGFLTPRLQRGLRDWSRFHLRPRRRVSPEGCRMVLKAFPKDADVGALVQISMDMMQTTLLRFYEIIEIERRSLTDDEHQALNAMLDLFQIAESDVQRLKRRMGN